MQDFIERNLKMEIDYAFEEFCEICDNEAIFDIVQDGERFLLCGKCKEDIF